LPPRPVRRGDPGGRAPRSSSNWAPDGIRALGKPGSVLFDVKQVAARDRSTTGCEITGPGGGRDPPRSRRRAAGAE
jgi:hypothetical protein